MPSTLVVTSTHRPDQPDSDPNLEGDKETDPSHPLDVRPTAEEGELSQQDKNFVTAELDQVLE